MNAPSPMSQPAASTSNAKPLSCVSCRQRKVKCDRVYPCATCQKAGLECVFPSRVRVPRGRKTGLKARDSELLTRIARLESLVSKVDREYAAKHSITQDDEVGTSAMTGPSMGLEGRDSPSHIDASTFATFVQRQENGSRYLGADFWTNLGEEMDGLRHLLEHPSDSESDSNVDESRNLGSKTDTSSGFIFGISDVTEPVDHQISDVHREALYRIYFSQVHPVYRIVHWPTLMTGLLGTAEPGLFNPLTDRYRFTSLEAIASAIIFMAVSSMSQEKCMEEFGEERVILQTRYKRRAEKALADADFLNSMEITTLQAFAIYVLALRNYSSSRTSWTLVSLCVRIAHSLGLHKDGEGRQYPAFEAEMRRRLWWSILVQDVRASEDRGATPVIQEDSFNTRIPCNLNDEDFSLMSVHPLPDKPGYTDMSFSLISMHVSKTVGSLNFIPTTKSRHNLTPQQKEDKVRECSQRIERLFLDGPQHLEPAQWATVAVGRLLILKLWTVIQFPLQSRPSASRPEFSRMQGLRTVIAYLELIGVIEENSNSEDFLWLFHTYVPWHPVAVALAELINNPKGPLADKIWEVVTRKYKKWGELIADTKEGMLWRPLKKLYKRAQAARELRTEQELEQSIANVVPIVNSAWDNHSTVMDIAKQDDNFMSASAFASDHANLPIRQAAIPDFSFNWNPIFDIHDMQPELGSEMHDDQINWDDWNEFVHGVGELDSSAQQNNFGEWHMPM